MQTAIKKITLISAMIVMIGTGVVGAQQTAHVTCGQGSDPTVTSGVNKPCNLTTDVTAAFTGAVGWVLYVFMAALIFILAWTMITALSDKVRSDPAALANVKKRIASLLMVLVVFFVIYNFSSILDRLGVQISPVVKQWIQFSALPHSLVSTAYAQTADNVIPSPIGTTSPYDFGLLLLSLFMNWIVFPGLVLSWIWVGVKFVFAQGNPQKIGEAKVLLTWVTVITIALVMIQTLAFALRETVTQITGK